MPRNFTANKVHSSLFFAGCAQAQYIMMTSSNEYEQINISETSRYTEKSLLIKRTLYIRPTKQLFVYIIYFMCG